MKRAVITIAGIAAAGGVAWIIYNKYFSNYTLIPTEAAPEVDATKVKAEGLKQSLQTFLDQGQSGQSVQDVINKANNMTKTALSYQLISEFNKNGFKP